MSEDRPPGQAGDFSALVGALRTFKAGPLGGHPSDRALAEAAEVSPTTIGEWLRGGRFPQAPGKILTVVRMVRDAAARRGITSPVDGPTGLLEEACWQEAYRAEAERRAGAVSSAVQRGQAARALAPPPTGWPLAEVRDPFALEVHRPVQPEDAPPGLPALPPYVPREHDQVMGQVVRAAADGRSGIAVLVGGSSTGKTRACWEALHLLRDQPGPWRLWHPIDPARPAAALRDLPGIGPRTVVWLNEAQFYLDAANGMGEQVAAGLRELLRDPARAPVLVLATLWPQSWDGLTARREGSADPHAQARELLAGHDITVPAAFTPAQLQRLSQAGDARLAQAAATAQDGQVVQFLAGAPELLARYRNAPPPAAALIHAAIDARRLGMGIGLPPAFLEAAAPGYLADAEWDALGEDWLEQALAYTAVPCKGVRGPLTRIRPRPAGSRVAGPSSRDSDEQLAGGPAHPLYRLADYLDQYGRHREKGHIPPAGFWAAAADHAFPADQAALGDAARARGLYRHAALLWKHAITASGNAAAAARLINFLHTLDGDGTYHAANWVSELAAVDDPGGVARLLEALRKARAEEAAATLATRAASHAAFDSAGDVAWLLKELRRAGVEEAAATLLARHPAEHVALDGDPCDSTSSGYVEPLLKALRDAGDQEAVATLAARVVEHVVRYPDYAAPYLYDPGNGPYYMAGLVNMLRRAGAEEAAAALAARVASDAPLDNPGYIATLLRALRDTWDQEAAAALLARHPAEHAALDSSAGDIAWLLKELRRAGAEEAAAALLARHPAEHVSLDSPGRVARLLKALRKAGDQEAAAALAARAASHAPLHDSYGDHPAGVVRLLKELRKAGAEEAAAALAARAASHAPLDSWLPLLKALRDAGAEEAVATLAARTASGAPLDNPWYVAMLLEALHRAGAEEAAAALLARHPAEHASLDDPGDVAMLLEALREAGAEEAAATLAARALEYAVEHDALARLLKELRKAGAEEAAAALAARAASDAPLDYAWRVARLLEELRKAGAEGAAAALAARVVSDVPLDNASYVALLLEPLRKAGAEEAAATLAARAASGGPLDNAWGVAWLLEELRKAGAEEAAAALLARHPAEHVALNHAEGVARLLTALRKAGAEEAAAALLARHPAEHVALNHAEGVARLLTALRKAGAEQAAAALLARHPAEHATVDGSLIFHGVAWLLKALRKAGAEEAAAALAARAASDAPLDYAWGVARLLEALRKAGAEEAAAALLARYSAEHIFLDGYRGVGELAVVLRAAGKGQALTTLATRVANGGLWQLILETDPDKARQYAFGREPDGAASVPWDWHDLADP